MVRRQRCATIRLEAISNEYQKSHTHVKFWLQERIEKCPSHLHQWFGFFSGKFFFILFSLNPNTNCYLNIRTNFFILLFQSSSLSSLYLHLHLLDRHLDNTYIQYGPHFDLRSAYGSDRTTTMATPCNT